MDTSKLKQNKTLRAGAMLTIVAIITLIAISFTFAKYVSEGSGSDNARVAKWGLNIPVNKDLNLFSDAYKEDGTPSAYDASGNIVKSGTQNQRVIAPGTHNTIDVTLISDVAPEVMYDFNINLKIEDITTQPGTTQESLMQLLDNYAPWKWTLGDQEFNNFRAFELAVIGLTQKDVPPNHLPDTKNITLGWKWDFDNQGRGTYDTYDTSMGNAAVVDAITHLKVSLNVDAVQCQGCTPTPTTKELRSIAVTNPPAKITYTPGESFDPESMVIKATYSDGTTADVTGYTYSPDTLNIPGEQTVTIFYTEGGVTKTTTLQITVTNPKASVKTPPTALATPPVYNGTPQTIANPGEAKNGTMMYAVTTTDTKPTEKTSFKTTIDQKTDAGNYYLWYYAKGDTGFDDSDVAGSVVCPIDRAEIDYPEPATGLVYIGESLTGVSAGTGYELIASGEPDTKVPTFVDGNAQGVDAGTYGVTAKVDGNHNWKEEPKVDPYNLTFTIEKADSNMSFEPATTSFSSNVSTTNVSRDFDAAMGASGTVTYAVNDKTEANDNKDVLTQVADAMSNFFNNLTGNTNTENDGAKNDSEHFQIYDGSVFTVNKLTCKANTPKATYNLVLSARDPGDDNHNPKTVTIGEDDPLTWKVKEPAATVKYAISLWGVDYDKKVATFGPATTDGAECPNIDHKTGEAGCIHNDSWSTIKENIKTNPHYYDDCISQGCTKDIELELNSSIANAQASPDKRASVLYNSIKNDYYPWNKTFSSKLEYECANYARSRIRATLNGYKPTSTSEDEWWTPSTYADKSTCLTGDTCLLSCFPEDLQALIVPKTFTVPTEWSTSSPYNIDESKNVVVEDKLWLANANEVFASPDSEYKDYGVQYARFSGKATSFNKCFREDGSAYNWWLRSPYRSFSISAAGVNDGGSSEYYLVSNMSPGLAPCFCIG